ncbi:MAG: type IV pili methyl-accepting chemotaxis transducer N-terminal domain-containing protein [Paracoccaceae bacterium]
MLKTLVTLAFAGTTTLFVSTAAVAEKSGNFILDEGASERIDVAGKLRMLSQRIPATACFAHVGIQTDENKATLASSAAEFSNILTALQEGSPEIGIPSKEGDFTVLRALKTVQNVWQPLQKNIDNVIDLGGYKWSVAYVANQSVPLLDESNWLSSVLIGEYSDPAVLLQADALTIDIAGRQRTLSQRIAKSTCLYSTGLETVYAGQELVEARQHYDASLNALRFGMPEAGIQASKSAQINSELDEILVQWGGVQSILDAVVAGKAVSDADREEVLNVMNALTLAMETVVIHYNDESKLGL